ncbi:DUF4352 domain-containing protein [Actinocrinis puniceicyclus]|uniref:DUF4352 domain-containing protein n=1 Tax=Actinocrinis puniceicyclus TaxID=977794 RepID=A0A8J7WTZ1_9ACTN|nr:DUF4352 domain-containing protein [Actinocrinis puniceicyclus]MBS2966432.1 DUF4352 domain-containing protein [Actinocrinis puniceicyclus]
MAREAGRGWQQAEKLKAGNAMRKILALLPVALIAAACTSKGVTTTPAAPHSASGTSAASQAPSSAAPQKAGVGDAINLQGDGTTIEVTVIKIVDPDTPSNEFETPKAGTHYASVQFQLLDKGPGSYQDDPLIDAQVKDATGQTFKPAIVTETGAGPQMSSSTNLPKGDKALGFITFEIPSGSKVTQVQYNLNGGLFGTTAQWTVG